MSNTTFSNELIKGMGGEAFAKQNGVSAFMALFELNCLYGRGDIIEVVAVKRASDEDARYHVTTKLQYGQTRTYAVIRGKKLVFRGHQKVFK